MQCKILQRTHLHQEFNMTKTKIALAAAVLTLPLMSFAGAADAAATHNLQSGTRTSNAYDSIATAYANQVGGYQESAVQYRRPASLYGR
jgi:hypothetical protein